jgi:hypothetical protein
MKIPDKNVRSSNRHMMNRVAVLVLLASVLLSGTMLHARAAVDGDVARPAESRVGAGTIFEGDKLLAGTQISNEGEIKGDLVMAGQNGDMQGTVGGDLLAVGSDLSVSGKVLGSLRSGSGNLLLSGEVGRNLTSFSGTATLTENSIVRGNLYLVGETAILQGTITGTAWVAASTVTLSGTFLGDVTVEAMQRGNDIKTNLVVMPGTVIKGTLAYHGTSESSIPSDASIGRVKFTKVAPAKETARTDVFGWKQMVRSLLTVLLLYLIGLLLLRLFSGFFARPAAYLRQNPFAVAGVGVAALGVSVAAVIMSFLFGLIAIFLFKPVVVLTVSLLLTTVIVLFGALSMLPVSLWLGNLLTRGRGGIPGALAAGLACLTIIRLLLVFLSGLPVIGIVFAVILGLFGIAVWLLGTGAMLRTVKLYHESAARGLSMADETLPVA